ncbi:MAG: phosphatidylserine decarboxylase family protein [Nitrospiraceae bacterium]|nr:MAG: phosphatidylserine decarboxylase family protein [Nitrospiraceae bacterium]
MLQLAKEGYPFIIFFAAVTILSIIFRAHWVTVAALVLTLFMFYFFRDPDRAAVPDINSFYAPADGKVIQIRETFEDELLKEQMIEISIFMNAFNVHVNRVPCKGLVQEVKYYPGRFKAAFKEDASKANEHINMVMECKHGTVMLRQVAGLLARRAVCRVKPGDSLEQGERYGIIKFSSRVDTFLPLGTEVKVQSGDRVKAGETLLGTIKQ